MNRHMKESCKKIDWMLTLFPVIVVTGLSVLFFLLILSIIRTIPGKMFVLVLLLLTMIAFYATSFDSIALTASCYSYYKLEENEKTQKMVQLLWCILLVVLPIALVFAESSMSNLQSVSIIAAFPIGIVMLLIVTSFMIDARDYLNQSKENAGGQGK